MPKRRPVSEDINVFAFVGSNLFIGVIVGIPIAMAFLLTLGNL